MNERWKIGYPAKRCIPAILNWMTDKKKKLKTHSTCRTILKLYSHIERYKFNNVINCGTLKIRKLWVQECIAWFKTNYCIIKAFRALVGRPLFLFWPRGTVFASGGTSTSFSWIFIPKVCLHCKLFTKEGHVQVELLSAIRIVCIQYWHSVHENLKM